jgi:hypothetical protein
MRTPANIVLFSLSTLVVGLLLSAALWKGLVAVGDGIARINIPASPVPMTAPQVVVLSSNRIVVITDDNIHTYQVDSAGKIKGIDSAYIRYTLPK